MEPTRRRIHGRRLSEPRHSSRGAASCAAGRRRARRSAARARPRRLRRRRGRRGGSAAAGRARRARRSRRRPRRRAPQSPRRRLRSTAAARRSRCGGGASRRRSASRSGSTRRSRRFTGARRTYVIDPLLMDTRAGDPAVHERRRGRRAAGHPVRVQRHLPHGERLARLHPAAERPRLGRHARRLRRDGALDLPGRSSTASGSTSSASASSTTRPRSRRQASIRTARRRRGTHSSTPATRSRAPGSFRSPAGIKDGFFGEWYFVNTLTQNLNSPADALNLFIGELDWREPQYHEHWVKLQELVRQRLHQRRHQLARALPGHPAHRDRQGRDDDQHDGGAAGRAGDPRRPARLHDLADVRDRLHGRHPDHRHAGLLHPDRRQGSAGRRRVPRVHALRGSRQRDVDDLAGAAGGREVRLEPHRRPVPQDASTRPGGPASTTSTSPTSCRRSSGRTRCS